MKKVIIFSILALTAAVFMGCAAEDKGTTLKWTNESGGTVSDIAWTGSGDAVPDQTWDSAADTATTDAKGIEKLNGIGDCVDASGPAELILAKAEGVIDVQGAAAQIEENADARLRITATKKK